MKQLGNPCAFFERNITYPPRGANLYDSVADYYEAKAGRKNAFRFAI